jgi:hypothetical protein
LRGIEPPAHVRRALPDELARAYGWFLLTLNHVATEVEAI